ncbi:MAG: hypothetical protein ACTSRP_04120 [Candidatus Helarchaeota archaeon]
MRKIINRLNKLNAYYYDDTKGQWKKITSFLDKIPNKSPIRISGIEYNQLKYDYDLGYFFGLAIGTSYNIKNTFKMVIENQQLPFIEKFAERLGIEFNLSIQGRKRKAYRKQSFYYYQKITIQFHNSLKSYLKAYGLNVEYPKILNEFNDELKLGIIHGLFDSKKAHYVFNNRQFGIHEYVILRLLDSKKLTPVKKRYLTEFSHQIKDILYQLGIKSSITNKGIQISGKSNLTLLFKYFPPNKVKSVAMAAILELRTIKPYYTTIINLYPLTEIDLVIWGYLISKLYGNDVQRVPYTYLETAFKVGSQIIRSSLYKLDELGFIKYFARGKKEFIALSDKVVELTKKSLNTSSKENKFDNNLTYVECPVCFRQEDYLSCIDYLGFYCPQCGSLMNVVLIEEDRKNTNESRQITKFINSVIKTKDGNPEILLNSLILLDGIEGGF